MAKTSPKFLPFVSDKTPIYSIKEKLWESGFGVPDNILLSILTLVEEHGVKEVRNRLGEVSHLDSWEDRYKEILKSETTYTKKLVKILKELQMLCKVEDWEGVTEEANKDIFCVFALFSAHPEYSTVELSNFLYLNLLERDKIPKGAFFNDSVENSLTLSTIHQIYAYVFYSEAISKQVTVPVRLIYMGVDYADTTL